MDAMYPSQAPPPSQAPVCPSLGCFHFLSNSYTAFIQKGHFPDIRALSGDVNIL